MKPHLLFCLCLALALISCKKETEPEGLDYYNAHSYVFEKGDLLIQKTTSFGYRFWLKGDYVNTSGKWENEVSADSQYPDLHYHFKPYSWDDDDELNLDIHFIDKKQYTVTFSPNHFSARLSNGGLEKVLVTIPSGALLFTVNDEELDKNGDAVLDKYQSGL